MPVCQFQHVPRRAELYREFRGASGLGRRNYCSKRPKSCWKGPNPLSKNFGRLFHGSSSSPNAARIVRRAPSQSGMVLPMACCRLKFTPSWSLRSAAHNLRSAGGQVAAEFARTAHDFGVAAWGRGIRYSSKNPSLPPPNIQKPDIWGRGNDRKGSNNCYFYTSHFPFPHFQNRKMGEGWEGGCLTSQYLQVQSKNSPVFITLAHREIVLFFIPR